MVKLKFLGHSSFVVSFDSINLLIDPFINTFSEEPRFERIIPAAAKESQLKNISVILVSHEHFDHFDKKAIEEIALRDNAIVVSHDSLLSELSLPKNLLHPLSMNQKIDFKGIQIASVTAHHPSAFYPMGFLLKSNNETVYHAGDTDLLEDFSGLKADLALLPIGGTMTMDIVDAVKATKSMKPRFVVPMHYNTFPLIKADPKEFRQKIEKSILDTETKILEIGGTLKI